MAQFFFWLESTRVALTVGNSLSITAWLSAFHLLGFTLVMSSGVAWSLHASGAFLARVPTRHIASTALRLLALGLAISLVTGFALFAPRSSQTALNGVFQLKIALLAAAALHQLATNLLVLRKPDVSADWLRVGGVAGVTLWVALAITACWFILFE